MASTSSISPAMTFNAKIAFSPNGIIFFADDQQKAEAFTPSGLSKKFGCPIKHGDAIVPVKVWSKERNTSDHVVQQLAGNFFPRTFPLSLLLEGKEAQTLVLNYDGNTFNLICSQKEIDGKKFEDWICAQDKAFVYDGEKGMLVTFNFKAYLSNH